jgi:hypothetical protein
MSFEGGVMLFEVILEVTLMGDNTRLRQRGSRYVAGVLEETPSGLSASLMVTTSLGVELEV